MVQKQSLRLGGPDRAEIAALRTIRQKNPRPNVEMKRPKPTGTIQPGHVKQRHMHGYNIRNRVEDNDHVYFIQRN